MAQDDIVADPALKLKAQLYCGDMIAIGPGKAALLEYIAATGSISAAGRALGMSYRRSWLLVDAMNRCWAEPLVETAAGGKRGGGARLTTLGVTVLGHFRAIEAAMARSTADIAVALSSNLLAEPRSSQRD